MRQYELTYIVPPSLAEDEINTIQETVKSWVIDQNGEVVKVSPWGRRTLAYMIQTYKEGYYTLIEFKAEPDILLDLDRRLRLDANIIRHLIVQVEPSPTTA